MTMGSAETAVLTRFRTLITEGGDGGSAVPTKRENVDSAFTEPTGNGPWCEVFVVVGGRRVVDTAPTYRTMGELVVYIYQRESKGRDLAKNVADRIDAAFRGAKAGGVRYRSPVPVNLGIRKGSSWWALEVSVPFEFDETLNHSTL